MNTDKTFAGIAVLALAIFIVGAIIFLIISIVKHLIWYNADLKYRYAQYGQAQKELDRLEEDIEQHKDYDWTKEPGEQSFKATNVRPGSDAHYAAWREEQLKKKAKEGD